MTKKQETQRQPAISDEQIVAAIIQAGSVTQAAQTLGISPRSMYDRMGRDSFRAAYSAAKSDIIRSAVYTLNQSLSDAVETVREIMHSETSSAGTKLQAARMIIDSAARFSERLNNEDWKTGSAGQSAELHKEYDY